MMRGSGRTCARAEIDFHVTVVAATVAVAAYSLVPLTIGRHPRVQHLLQAICTSHTVVTLHIPGAEV